MSAEKELKRVSGSSTGTKKTLASSNVDSGKPLLHRIFFLKVFPERMALTNNNTHQTLQTTLASEYPIPPPSPSNKGSDNKVASSTKTELVVPLEIITAKPRQVKMAARTYNPVFMPDMRRIELTQRSHGYVVFTRRSRLNSAETDDCCELEHQRLVDCRRCGVETYPIKGYSRRILRSVELLTWLPFVPERRHGHTLAYTRSTENVSVRKQT